MNESSPASAPDVLPPSPEELERDLRMELILDECVTELPAAPFEAELTARVMAARPFAAWEVRRARAWRIPAVGAAALLVASLAIFLAPLWSLGPGTAFETWARVMAAGTAGGLPALLAGLPALASALAAALAGAPGTRPAVGGALLASGTVFALLARRLARRPSRLLAGARRG
ncbi:MAG TPA: hypothetical protein VLJ18_03605 [Thermoanaerobaculia bacterium]|nr:hypothetical protein [Thermoanaerobaculia bacterium]